MNYTMNTLKAIGIILVIAGHNATNLLSWFTPYSFHMALFIFISGYFYKADNEDHWMLYIKKKIKSLIIPYYKVNIFYAVLVATLLNAGLINFGSAINLKSFFIEPWLSGHQYIFNLAGWFIFTLFNIMLFFVLIRKILRKYIKSEYFWMLIFFLIGLGGVYLAIYKEYTMGLSLILSRTMFGVSFFQLGYLYKEKLESKDKFNFIILMIVIMLQGWLVYKTKNSISYVMVFMSFANKNIVIPFITSITGIYIYLHIAKFITAYYYGKDKFITLIGRSTWSIMLHHIFGMWLLNLIFYLFKIYGMSKFNNFDIIKFQTDIWYRYLFMGEATYVFYFIAGLFIPIMIKIVVGKFKLFWVSYF